VARTFGKALGYDIEFAESTPNWSAMGSESMPLVFDSLDKNQ
jgi:hypothetical protein